VNIHGREEIKITQVILDFNGTIAIDGKLVNGVADEINRLANSLDFYVVTADTYGTVAKELIGVNCQIINLSNSEEFRDKLDVLIKLGKNETLCVGNGFNDRIVLKESVLGISILQEEGLNVDALIASDFVCKSIIDVFSCIENPDRIKATMRA